MLDVPKPGLKGRTTPEIPAVETWQPPSRSREKSYFTFHSVGSGKGAGGDNVVSWPALMLSGLSVMYPNQTKGLSLKGPSFVFGSFMSIFHPTLFLFL